MFSEEVLKQIRDNRKDLEANLIRGNARDYAEYQHRIGVIKGLDMALEIIKTFIGGNDE